MPNTPIEVLSLSDWSGGLNTESPIANIATNELSVALNCELGLNGHVLKRKGFSAYSFSEHANMASGRFLFFWDQLGSANDWFILVDEDGDVFDETGADWSTAAQFDITAAGTGTNPVAAVAFDNVLYITSLRANPRSFDGTTWTEITDITLDGDGAGVEFAKAAFALTKHERVFAANIDNNGTRERSRIRWSDVGDATTWQTLSWIDVDPDDGSEITGMVSFADGILIFKSHKMFFLSGVDEDTFTLFPVDSSVGTDSPGTIAVGDKAVFFLDNTKGVFMYDGTGVKNISRKVQSEILEHFTRSDTEYPFFKGVFYRDKYYLSGFNPGPTDGRTYVFDTRLEAWVRWSVGFYGAAERNGSLYVVGLGNSVGIKQAEATNYTDSGVSSYAWSLKTGAIYPTSGEGGTVATTEWRYRGVDVSMGNDALGAMGSSVEVGVEFDFGSQGSDPTFDLSSTTDSHETTRTAYNGSKLLKRSIAVLVSDTAVANGSVNGINIYFSRRRSVRKARGLVLP